MPRSQGQKTSRFVVPGVALLLAMFSVAYGLRSCAEDNRNRAYLERQAPLAKSMAKHRPLLARAAALQPNFKELSHEITPSRCRELLDLVRARYELDPFRVQARCEGKEVSSTLEVCEGARVFADLGGAESQHGLKVGVVLQARKRVEDQDAPRLDVTTLLLGVDHAMIELHHLAFDGDSMHGKSLQTTVRALGPDGLLERTDRGSETELRATTPDGAVQLVRREGKEKSKAVVERVRGAGTSGWKGVYLFPSTGAWYDTSDGLACAAPSWTELEIVRKEDAVSCTRVRALDAGKLKEWHRGEECGEEK